jgi:hypothetical protein
MKHLFILLVLSGFLNLTICQDSSKTCTETHHGLQFQIGSLLSLYSFDNYTFSYRYRFNNFSGLRVGVLTYFNKEDNDITQQVDSITSKPPDYHHYYDFKISVQYLHSIMKYRSFSLILGGGPFISFSKDDYSNAYVYSSYTSEYKYKTTSTGYGLDLLCGVEYELAENILISGEYGLSLEKEKSNIDRTDSYIYEDPSQNSIRKQNGTGDTFSISDSNVKLGISVFF